VLRFAHQSPREIVEGVVCLTRSLVVLRSIAVTVVAASIVSLGVDLAQTAYTAARTAQTVVLANNG